ncbi:hypothetical protein KM043_018031 [Ampulex compressa]|nr:hypothetical protein KM043_018031 [Ampulex compressa]
MRVQEGNKSKDGDFNVNQSPIKSSPGLEDDLNRNKRSRKNSPTDRRQQVQQSGASMKNPPYDPWMKRNFEAEILTRTLSGRSGRC